MYASLWRHLEGGPISAVEESLLGSLILAPYLRLGPSVSSLLPSHFSSPNNAAIFRTVMKLKRPEAALVLADLDQSGPPVGSRGGWATLLSDTLSDPLVDDEAAEDAALAVKEASIKRAREARLRRLG